MKIEKPDWNKVAFIKGPIIQLQLSEWFDTHVEPINKMLSEGVEVYGETHFCEWKQNRTEVETHKAFLINIQPIKRETAEDVLRAYIKHDEMIDKREGLNKEVGVIYERAKAVLKEES